MKMDRTILKKIVPFVKEYASTRGGTGQGESQNAVCAVLHQKGINRIKYHYCYGGLKSYSSIGITCGTDQSVTKDKPLAIFLQVQPKPDEIDENAFRHYIEWVLNYSPWRNSFVSKNVSKVLKDGVVVVDPNTRSNTLGSSMIGLRQAWENYYSQTKPARYMKIQLWWKLSQKIDPTIAFTISNSLMNIDYVGKVYFTDAQSGHSPFNSEDAVLLGFINNANNDKSRPWSKSLGYSGPLSDIWYKAPIVSMNKLVKAALRDIDGDKGKANPFAATKTQFYKLEDAVDSIHSAINNVKDKLYA